MKKAIIISILCTLFLSGCSKEQYIERDDTDFYEWISPDGVHYWSYHTVQCGMLAPRYNSEGKLVISK